MSGSCTEEKPRAKCDSTARWAGTSPAWELVPQLQSKGKRTGSEQESQPEDGWAGSRGWR